MQLTEHLNLKYFGAKGRVSLLDVVYPSDARNLPILFFLHGFKGFKDWGCFPHFARALAKRGFVVIKFNFSHNGGTEDDPIDFPDLEAFSKNTYSKELEDIQQVYNWLLEDKSLSKEIMNLNAISVLGHSRGGAMAILAAAKYSWIKQLVTMAAVADLEKRLPSKEDLEKWKTEGVHYIPNARTKQSMPMKYAFVEDLLENLNSLSVENAVREISIPQLILHGSADETVRVTDAKKIKSWNPNAQLTIIEGAGHTFEGKHPWMDTNLPEAMEEVLNEMIPFLKG